MDIASIMNLRHSAIAATNTTTRQLEQKQTTISERVNVRENMMNFIEHASPEALDTKLVSYMRYGGSPPGPVVNLKQIMAAGKQGEEIAVRISRLRQNFSSQVDSVRQQERELISQGRAENKTAKEILTDLVALYEQQSDFYKLATSWEGQTLSSPESYSRLVAMTPDYMDAYA